MTKTTIEQIKNSVKGQVYPSFEGTIAGAYDVKTGAGENGEWKKQSIKITQGQDFIYCDLWDKPEVTSADVGKSIAIVAFQGKRGLSGLQVHKYTGKDGAEKTSLKVTKSAEVIIGGAAQKQPHNAPQGDDGDLGPVTPKNAPTGQPASKASGSDAPFHHSATLCWALGQSITTMNAIGIDWLVEEKQLWQRASTLLRAHDALSAGKLAPKAEKHAPIAPEDVPTESDSPGF